MRLVFNRPFLLILTFDTDWSKRKSVDSAGKSAKRYSSAKLQKFADVCIVGDKFVAPTVQASVRNGLLRLQNFATLSSLCTYVPFPYPCPFPDVFWGEWASAPRLDFEGVCLRQFSANRLQTWQSYYSNLKVLFPAESTDFRLLVHVKS